MYDYVVKELPKLLSENFPQLDVLRASIFGHSMGGHGALTIYLKNLDKYKVIDDRGLFYALEGLLSQQIIRIIVCMGDLYFGLFWKCLMLSEMLRSSPRKLCMLVLVLQPMTGSFFFHDTTSNYFSS